MSESGLHKGYITIQQTIVCDTAEEELVAVGAMFSLSCLVHAVGVKR